MHSNLGTAYADQGNLDEAIAEWKTTLSIKPNDAKAHNNLGLVYKTQGNSKQAIAHFKEFIRLARTNPSLQSKIPEVQELIQQLESGR